MSVPLSGSLVLIGAGKMGGALLEGWLRSGVAAEKIIAFDPSPPDEISQVIERQPPRRRPKPGLTSLPGVEVGVVAAKPQVMEDVLPPLRGLSAMQPLVISVVA